MLAWEGVPGEVLGLTFDSCPDGFPNILLSSAQPHPSGGLIIDKESEVYKMLQEKQELNEPPKQSTSFLVLQEILESDGKGKEGALWRVCLCRNTDEHSPHERA